MADQDEDIIVRNDIDLDTNDIADDTQDFRFLSSLSHTNKSDQKIPKRGEKDFEHHGTRSQEEVLHASRQAMHDALAPPRIHKPSALTGFFDPDNGDCVIEEPKGVFLATMGRSDAHNHTYLLPEECLYLLERGTLNLQWRTSELRDLPVSLQTAYAYLIGSQGLTLERYVVYAGLKRAGYIVQRAATWDPEDYDKGSKPQRPAPPPPISPPSLYSRVSALLFPQPPPPPPPPPLGPLIQPGLYRSYTPIYTSLGTLIPFHDPRVGVSGSSSQQHGGVLRPSFNIYKPSTPHFRKAFPPTPHYRICVLSARDDPFPSCEQLDGLLACVPYEPPPEGSEGKTYQRVRHGYRSVVLAVVDAGVVSYVRVGESGMGCEPVWDRGGPGRGGKGGGRGGGRGRGRGAGRGRGG